MEDPYIYELSDLEYLDICAGRQHKRQVPKTSDFMAQRSFKTTNECAAYIQSREQEIKQEILQTDPMYLGYLRNIRLLQSEQKYCAHQTQAKQNMRLRTLSTSNVLHKQRYFIITDYIQQVKQYLNLRKKYLLQQEKQRILNPRPSNSRKQAQQWSVSNADEAFSKFKLARQIQQQQQQSPKKQVLGLDINRTEMTTPYLSPKRFRSTPQKSVFNQLNMLATTNGSPINHTSESCMEPITENSLFNAKTSRNSKVRRTAYDITQVERQTLKEKIEILIEKHNLKKKDLLLLVERINAANKLIGDCETQKSIIRQQKGEIERSFVDQFKTYAQYLEFVTTIQSLCNVENVSWHSILSYTFANLIEDERNNQKDFHKERQTYFDLKIQNQSSYYDIENIQRRDFLAMRRKKDKSLC